MKIKYFACRLRRRRRRHRPAAAADVICYNCPPEWADWGSMLKAIKADLGSTSRTTTRIPARRWRN